MTNKKFRQNQPIRFSERKIGRISKKSHKPFWLPAPGYYILSVAIIIAIFFLFWAILQEGGEESPWLVSGIISSALLAGAVILREVVLRKARQKYLRAERQLDYNLDNISRHSNIRNDVSKLSLKNNAALIEQIKSKSDAAKILGHLPDGHWEVFELCNKYLNLNKKQLETVGVGSPRLAALRRGREIVEKLHKYHLLSWVESEAKFLTEEANNQIQLEEKIDLIQRALLTIDSALEFYPDDQTLLASKDALKEFISSIKISFWIEQAERETFKKNYRKAISLYRDALFYLARENVQNEEKKKIADKINNEIELIRNFESEFDYENDSDKNKIKKIKGLNKKDND